VTGIVMMLMECGNVGMDDWFLVTVLDPVAVVVGSGGGSGSGSGEWGVVV
jgi:hypothetical protein